MTRHHTMAACVLFHHHEPDRPREALPGLRTCAGHRRALASAVSETPGLLDELAQTLASPQGGTGQRRSRGASTGIALHEAVAEHRSVMRTSLAGWARIVCEERGHTPPADDPRAIATFLARNLDWICAQPFVDDAHGELCANASRARLLRQLPPWRTWPLPHQHSCGGVLWAYIPDAVHGWQYDGEREASVMCDRCGMSHPVFGNLVRNLVPELSGRRMLTDAATVARELNLSVATVYGKCSPAAYHPQTREGLYDVEDCRRELKNVRRRRKTAEVTA